MGRISAALGWSVLGLIAGAIIGALAGFVIGLIRVENAAQAALAGAPPVGLIGALGAFAGCLLARPAAESDNLTGFTLFLGALLGALAGATIGKALGADTWLLDSLAKVENESSLIFLHYHIDLFGGPHVVVGAFLGILAFGILDVFLGSESSLVVLVIAALLSPVLAIIAAFIGQIDWGAALVIVVATVAIFYVFMKSTGGASSSTEAGGGKTSGAKPKGKGKAKHEFKS